MTCRIGSRQAPADRRLSDCAALDYMESIGRGADAAHEADQDYGDGYGD